jgi:hypothetical protein
MPSHLLTLLLALFTLLAGSEPNSDPGDTGAGLDPNG